MRRQVEVRQHRLAKFSHINKNHYQENDRKVGLYFKLNQAKQPYLQSLHLGFGIAQCTLPLIAQPVLLVCLIY
mgnify:CR=1 FL=1